MQIILPYKIIINNIGPSKSCTKTKTACKSNFEIAEIVIKRCSHLFIPFKEFPPIMQEELCVLLAGRGENACMRLCLLSLPGVGCLACAGHFRYLGNLVAWGFPERCLRTHNSQYDFHLSLCRSVGGGIFSEGGCGERLLCLGGSGVKEV